MCRSQLYVYRRIWWIEIYMLHTRAYKSTNTFNSSGATDWNSSGSKQSIRTSIVTRVLATRIIQEFERSDRELSDSITLPRVSEEAMEISMVEISQGNINGMSRAYSFSSPFPFWKVSRKFGTYGILLLEGIILL